MRRVLPYVNRLSGVILIPVGLYVAYYGWYELRLFGSESAGSAEDPVITAAGRLQRTLAGWVYQSGSWPWLLSLGALAVGVAVAARWRRSGRQRPAAPAPRS
jgi:hypothetical protein